MNASTAFQSTTSEPPCLLNQYINMITENKCILGVVISVLLLLLLYVVVMLIFCFYCICHGRGFSRMFGKSGLSSQTEEMEDNKQTKLPEVGQENKLEPISTSNTE
ncbi:hypothetical protein RF11_06306 [Thelohanellus kitauei]|uniref:Uncharacterized protein n=1 Tax=Thelohanellus kitauei TaxID=669202 RepID=A0A0C2IRP1_THEKT|nr:hypothetical protein RF11_06306 [Thelohanellus kitauei]